MNKFWFIYIWVNINYCSAIKETFADIHSVIDTFEIYDAKQKKPNIKYFILYDLFILNFTEVKIIEGKNKSVVRIWVAM